MNVDAEVCEPSRYSLSATRSSGIRDIKETVLALLADGLSLAGVPGGSVVSALFKDLQEKRTRAAHEILLDTIRSGEVLPHEVDLGEIVPMIHRYFRAAMEGTARRNLQQIARIFAGGGLRGLITADEFLYATDILASLRAEEIVVLGVWARAHEKAEMEEISEETLKNWGEGADKYRMGMAKVHKAYTQMNKTMTQEAHWMDFNATISALMRTGFVLRYEGITPGPRALSPLFLRLHAMAPFETPSTDPATS